VPLSFVSGCVIQPGEIVSAHTVDENGRTISYRETVTIKEPKKTTLDGIADWERYEKGIGSRLLEKFGYIRGTGLGIKKTGIAEPIPMNQQAGNSKLGLGHESRDKNKPKILSTPKKKNGRSVKVIIMMMRTRLKYLIS